MHLKQKREFLKHKAIQLHTEKKFIQRQVAEYLDVCLALESLTHT